MTQDFKQWWDAWWEEDYSWDGLAKKPWHGWCVKGGEVIEDRSSWPKDDRRHKPRPQNARPATLQDYWRKILWECELDPEKALLTCPNTGRLYTTIHFPSEGADESRRSDQVQLLQQAFRGQSDGEFDEFGMLVGPDRRVQLNGAVLQDFIVDKVLPEGKDKSGSPLRLSAERCFFSGMAQFSYAEFSGAASFENTVFSEAAYFVRSKFEHVANFKGSNFIKHARFDKAQFIEDALFEDSVYLGDAWFNSTAFCKWVNFKSAVFYSRARFEGEGATLAQRSRSSDRPSGDRASIAPSQVGSTARKEAVDLAERSFKSATFEQAVFFELAAFDNRDIHEASSFSGAWFLKEATFHGARMHQGISFLDAAFEGSLAPTRQHNKGRLVGWLDRVLSEVQYKLLFLPWKLPRLSLTPQRRAFIPPQVALERLHAAVMSQRNASKHMVMTLDVWVDWLEKRRQKEAWQFKKLPQSEPASDKQRFNKVPKHNETGDVVPRQETICEFGEILPDKRPLCNSKAHYFDKLESAFRTLKQAMEGNRDMQGAARFFRLELLARRKKLDVPRQWGEWFLSWLYEAVSDFGNSVWRPLGVLIFALIPLFALLYATLATTTWPQLECPEWAEFKAAVPFSFSRALPLGPWAETEPCSLMGQLLDKKPEATCEKIEPVDPSRPKTYVAGTAFGVSLIATFQSVLALILVFLSGVAARRRFQIN